MPSSSDRSQLCFWSWIRGSSNASKQLLGEVSVETLVPSSPALLGASDRFCNASLFQQLRHKTKILLGKFQCWQASDPTSTTQTWSVRVGVLFNLISIGFPGPRLQTQVCFPNRYCGFQILVKFNQPRRDLCPASKTFRKLRLAHEGLIFRLGFAFPSHTVA